MKNATGFTMLLMAKKTTTKKPLPVRIENELFDRLVKLAEREKYPPTLTTLVEAAIRRFVEDEERAAKSKGK